MAGLRPASPRRTWSTSMLARWIPLGSQQPAGLGTAKKLEKRCKGPCFNDNPRRGEFSSARISTCAVSDLVCHRTCSTNGALRASLLLYAHGAKLCCGPDTTVARQERHTAFVALQK
ncbi:hypothetical protein TgHK011_001157 [Trichoderma gracile]|nr:hypothetical protein TgHK011_001157 [Trichoderma gracile]